MPKKLKIFGFKIHKGAGIFKKKFFIIMTRETNINVFYYRLVSVHFIYSHKFSTCYLIFYKIAVT